MILLDKKSYIYFVSIVISFLLTAICIYHYPVFNVDGSLYLRSADVYLHKGLGEAMHLYNWPLYYLTIAWTSNLTGLSILNSAYLLNYLFSALTVITFVALIGELGGSKKILWISALVILVFHQFNKYQPSLIRGHGYWLFFLLSLFFLVRFSKYLNWRNAIAWSFCIILATLFRIEGAVLLFFAPLIVWFFYTLSWRQRFFAYIKLNILIIIELFLFFGIYLYHHMHGFNSIHFNSFGRISELMQNTIGGDMASAHFFQQHALTLRNHVLPFEGAGDANLFLFFGMLGIYVFTIVSTFSLTYTIPALYSGFKRLMPASVYSRYVLLAYIIINVVVTCLFYSQSLFLSFRYVFPLALVLLCYVPFGLEGLYYQWKNRTKNLSIRGLLFPFVCVMMLGLLVGNLFHTGPSHQYIYDAGKWLKANTNTHATVYTNSGRLGYFADRKFVGWNNEEPNCFNVSRLSQRPWIGYNYLALLFDSGQDKVQQQVKTIIGKEPIKSFYYKRRDKTVLIFKLK